MNMEIYWSYGTPLGLGHYTIGQFKDFLDFKTSKQSLADEKSKSRLHSCILFVFRKYYKTSSKL